MWVYANVFQDAVGRLRPGDPAQVTVDAYPGRAFNGRVDQILPEVDPATRTVRVRLIFRNPGVVLKPGMYVNVDINLPLGKQLVIPASAVLQSGSRAIAFIDHGDGNLEPREIQTGPQIEDSVIVLKGLQPGDHVVSSANFLVDSEAQLQAALGSFTPPQQNANPENAQSSGSNSQHEQIKIELTTEPSIPQKGKNMVRIKLTGADGKPVDGVQVSAIFSMPAMPAMGMAAAARGSLAQRQRPGHLRRLAGARLRWHVARRCRCSACRSHHRDQNAHRRCNRRDVMISRIIAWCASNPFLVFTAAILLTVAGVWSLQRVPLDALPDISDVQVVVHTNWPGEPPDVVEDQVTYPIVTALLAAPHVKSVRAQTMFGDSCVFVIFDDSTDLYWARSRVLEYMQQLAGRLPADVHPSIGPDATGAGWVYEYAIVDRSHKLNLADLRALQDWSLRYKLETVPGVAEVATIGGFVRQYQVNLDPQKLFSYGIPASTVIDRVRQSTNEVGGDVLEMGGAEYMIRGLGYLRNVADLENVPVATKNGTPVLVRDLGTVTLGPDVRRGAADWQGEGETVGGIVVTRYGTNALKVIDGVKAKLKEIGPSLPPGVEIVTAYDRSWLINQSIHTLKRDLIIEAIIVSFVCILFLFHFRSALVPIITLPIAALAAFIPMYYLKVSSNIMSLGGLALAVGVLIDAAIVIVENGYRHIAERKDATELNDGERRRILVGAAQQVGPALFYSLIIIVVSFLPVFMLEAQEGRMFRPLAWTKTLALIFSSLLSITLVPALMPFFLRGKLRPEAKNPAARASQALYLPVLRWCLRHWKIVIALNLIFLAATIPLCFRLGSQFMPALYEGSALYMPSSLPGISITQAASLMQQQDRIIRSFPEVSTVFGTVGRSDSATDNAPLDMYDTTIMLEAARAMATRHDLRQTHSRDGREAAVPRPHQHVDHACPEPPRYGTDRDQDCNRHQDTGPGFESHPGPRRRDAAGAFDHARGDDGLCRTRIAGLLFERGSEPSGSCALRPHGCRYPARRLFRDRRHRYRRKHRRPRALPDCRSLPARLPRHIELTVGGADSHAFRRTDSRERSGARLLLAWPRNDSRRRWLPHRLCLSEPEDQRLRRLRQSRQRAAEPEDRAARRLHLALGGRIRVRGASQAAAHDHFAHRLLRHLSTSLSGLQIRRGGCCAHLPGILCHVRRAAAAMAAPV